MEPKDRLEVFSRDGVPFMQLEIRRDHMNVDMWLPEDKLVEARSTDLARPHPFDPDHAVVVRFERATDLTKVARWLEDAHAYAEVRKESYESGPAAPAPEPKREASEANKVAPKKTTAEKIATDGATATSIATKAKVVSKKTASRSSKPKTAAPKKAAAGAAKRPTAKRTAAARRA